MAPLITLVQRQKTKQRYNKKCRQFEAGKEKRRARKQTVPGRANAEFIQTKDILQNLFDMLVEWVYQQ